MGKIKRKLKELNKRVESLEKQLFSIEVNDPQIIGKNELITNPFDKVVGSCEKVVIPGIKESIEDWKELRQQVLKTKEDAEVFFKEIETPSCHDEEKKYTSAVRYFESLPDNDPLKKGYTDSFTYDELIFFAERYLL